MDERTVYPGDLQNRPRTAEGSHSRKKSRHLFPRAHLPAGWNIRCCVRGAYSSTSFTHCFTKQKALSTCTVAAYRITSSSSKSLPLHSYLHMSLTPNEMRLLRAEKRPCVIIHWWGLQTFRSLRVPFSVQIVAAGTFLERVPGFKPSTIA